MQEKQGVCMHVDLYTFFGSSLSNLIKKVPGKNSHEVNLRL